MVGATLLESNHSKDGYARAERVATEHVRKEYEDFLSGFMTRAEAVTSSLEKSTSSGPPYVVVTHCSSESKDAEQLIPSEGSSTLQLIVTFTSLVNQMDCLMEDWEKYVYPLLYYGEGFEEREFTEGDCHSCVARMTPYFQMLLEFVSRCYSVVRNSIEQLALIYDNSGAKTDLGDTHFKLVFERIGALLLVLAGVDVAVNSNTKLREHVAQFQHIIRSVQQEPQTFQTTESELKQLDEFLSVISEKLLSGNIFLRCITDNFTETSSTPGRNPYFLKEMALNIRGLFQDLIQRLENEDQRENLDLLHCYAALITLHVFHSHLQLKTDKKQFKIIWDSLKYVPAVPLFGSCLWFPDQFLASFLPDAAKVIDAKMLDTSAAARVSYLKNRTQQLAKYVSLCSFQVTLWLSRVKKQASTLEELGSQSGILLQGIALANQISGTVRLLLNLHVAVQPVISKGTVLGIFRLIELTKSLQSAFEKETTASALTLYEERLKHSLLKLIKEGRQNVSEKRRGVAKLAALDAAERSLQGPASRTRISATRLALAMACGVSSTRIFSEEDFPVLISLVQKLEQISREPLGKLSRTVSGELLYWHKSLIDTYFKDAYEKRVPLSRINCVLRAMYDCCHTLQHAQHSVPERITDKWHVFVQQSVERNVLEPLCRDVENELRIQTHSHLPQAEHNPLKSEVPFVGKFLEDVPLRLGRHFLSVRAHVEHYLGRTFYDLAAVASHDWRKYGEMRLLARHIFNLNPIEDRLPSQTLEQGLDVLEIMRNIHVFVSRFSYNLNNQFFVEQSSESKHLNCIGIRQVSNSIRTHGPGIVNTAINFTYQFLRKKFYVFSQFLFDEHIKSRLMKDARYLREIREKEEGQPQHSYRVPDTQLGKYPYDRAEKFNRGIRRLGLNAEGLSYLDQFRMLITQLGNSLGYVRMLRSGAIHCCAEACASVPDLAELVDLSDSALNLVDNKSTAGSNRGPTHDVSTDFTEGLFENLTSSCPGSSAVSLTSAKDLDSVLDGLAKSLSEGSDYFKLLVGVFWPFFRDPRQIHLRNFYILVPPLMVNYIEHIITCKEKLNKKNKHGASFTDDGFVMGVAYALAVLEQWKEFDSLQWFASVKNHFSEQRIAVSRNLATGQDVEKLGQTMSLTVRRLDTYQQEYDLLFYNLNSARIFFRDDKTEQKSGCASLADESNQGSSQ